MKYFLSAINEADGYGIEKYFISALQGGSNLDTGDDVGEGVCQYLSITDQLRIGQSYCLRWVVVNNFLKYRYIVIILLMTTSIT